MHVCENGAPMFPVWEIIRGRYEQVDQPQLVGSVSNAASWVDMMLLSVSCSTVAMHLPVGCCYL